MSKLFDYFQVHSNEIIKALIEHILLCFSSVLIGSCIALLIIIWGTLSKRNINGLIHFFSFLRLIPGVALLVIAMPILGIGVFPTLISLTFLTIPSVLLNAYSGIKNIPVFLMECAEGIGLSRQQVLFKIQLPMTSPFIVLGLRTAVVDAVAVAAVASLMGSGGLGRYILTGLAINNLTLIVIGGMMIAMLALICEFLLGMLQKKLEKKVVGGEK